MLTPDELALRGFEPDEIDAMLDAEREALSEEERQDYLDAMEEQAMDEARGREEWPSGWEDYSDSRRDL